MDFGEPSVLASTAAAVAQGPELILLLLNHKYVSLGFNFVVGTRKRLGYAHFLLAAPSASECALLTSFWGRFNESAPACGWVSSDAATWEPWGEAAKLHHFFSMRWLIASRLVNLGFNVLALDLDALLVSDIYPKLHSSPLSTVDIVVQGNYGYGINCGFVYLRARDSHSAVHPQRVNKLRGALRQNSSRIAMCTAPSSEAQHRCRTAAGWLVQAVYERILQLAKADPAGIDPTVFLWENMAWSEDARPEPTGSTRARLVAHTPDA